MIRPAPLTILGTVNLTLGVLGVIGFIAVFDNLRAPDWFALIAFGLIFPLLAIVLLLVSGAGIFRQSKRWGRGAAMLHCVTLPIGAFLPTLIYGKYEFPLGVMSIFSLLYPAVLFYLVGYRYRDLFTKP